MVEFILNTSCEKENFSVFKDFDKKLGLLEFKNKITKRETYINRLLNYLIIKKDDLSFFENNSNVVLSEICNSEGEYEEKNELYYNELISEIFLNIDYSSDSAQNQEIKYNKVMENINYDYLDNIITKKLNPLMKKIDYLENENNRHSEKIQNLENNIKELEKVNKERYDKITKHLEEFFKRIKDNTKKIDDINNRLLNKEIYNIKKEIEQELEILVNFFTIKETFPEFIFGITKEDYENTQDTLNWLKLKDKIQNISFDTVLGNFLIDFDVKKYKELENILPSQYKLIYPKENEKLDVNMHNDKEYESNSIIKRGFIIRVISLGLKTENKVCKFADVVVAT